MSATPLATPAQMPARWAASRTGGFICSQRAEARVAVVVQRQMVRRHLDAGDVLVVGEEAISSAVETCRTWMRLPVLCASATSRCVDEQRRLRRRARPGGADGSPSHAQAACARAAGTRPRNGRRRGGEYGDRIASTPSSSATSSEPVEEPMNTLTPAQPGSFSSSGGRRHCRACRRHRRRGRNACGPCARASLSSKRLARDGRSGWCWASRRRRSRRPSPRRASRSRDLPCARRPARGNAPGCR